MTLESSAGSLFRFTTIQPGDDRPGYRRWSLDHDLGLSGRLVDGFKAGERLGWDQPVEVNSSNSGPIVDVPMCPTSCQIVSTRVKEIVERASVKAEWLRVRIMHKRRELEPGQFWLVNWLTVVEALDEAKSSIHWKFSTPDDLTVTKVVLDTARVPNDVNAFRLARVSDWIIFSEQLARAFQGAGVKGCYLKQVDLA